MRRTLEEMEKRSKELYGKFTAVSIVRDRKDIVDLIAEVKRLKGLLHEGVYYAEDEWEGKDHWHRWIAQVKEEM